jgi:hypothetical protein
MKIGNRIAADTTSNTKTPTIAAILFSGPFMALLLGARSLYTSPPLPRTYQPPPPPPPPPPPDDPPPPEPEEDPGAVEEDAIVALSELPRDEEKDPTERLFQLLPRYQPGA